MTSASNIPPRYCANCGGYHPAGKCPARQQEDPAGPTYQPPMGVDSLRDELLALRELVTRIDGRVKKMEGWAIQEEGARDEQDARLAALESVNAGPDLEAAREPQGAEE